MEVRLWHEFGRYVSYSSTGSQNHLREQMGLSLKPQVEWLIHLLTQVVLTSLSKLSCCSPGNRTVVGLGIWFFFPSPTGRGLG